MELPGWLIPVGAILFVIGVTIPLVLAWDKWRKAEALWTPINIPIHDARFKGMTTFIQLRSALNVAYVALVQHGPWDNDVLAQALAGLSIIVNDTETWTASICDENGHCQPGSVGGQGIVKFHTIAVGPSLAALCHEMVHIVEFKVEGVVDYTHRAWRARGLLDAIEAYAVALKDLNG